MRSLLLATLLQLAWLGTASGQGMTIQIGPDGSAPSEWPHSAASAEATHGRSPLAELLPETSPGSDETSNLWLSHAERAEPFDLSEFIVRGQSGGSGGDGAGAAAAVNPAVPLTQLQVQNFFIPHTFGASGYSNRVILQPVVPLNIAEDAFFPYHIVRPTLPVISPSPDPAGPAGVAGGLGDLLIVDAFIHPMKELQSSVGAGYVSVLPTATDPQLGLGEWQFGPSAFFITRAVPKWVIGVLYQMPFSMESDAYSAQAQLIATRLLEDNWYVGWGDELLILDSHSGDYHLPLTTRIGKVVVLGKQPINIFVQGLYTPDGFHQGPGAQWGAKLNVTFLFPNAKLRAPVLSRLAGGG